VGGQRYTLAALTLGNIIDTHGVGGWMGHKCRSGQDRTGQDRKGQDRTGQDRTGQDRTGLSRLTKLIILEK